MTEARDLAERLLKYASMPSCANPRLLNEAASALATPASDGLPEGWKATAALRDDGMAIYKAAFTQHWVAHRAEPHANDIVGSFATMSLSEACLAADERFPMVKPGAGWTKTRADRWERECGLVIVAQAKSTGRWGVMSVDPRIEPLRAFEDAVAAMVWVNETLARADRERPVA